MTASHIDKTICAYNRNAGKYADKFDNYDVYQKQITHFQKKCIPKGTHILDLGCGPGNNIKTILEQDSTCCFTGVDICDSFLDMAQQRFPQFTFLRQDIRNMDIKDRFQVILASFCIVHLKNEETCAFIKSLSRLLAKGGHLYLSYMNGESSGFERTSFSREKIFFNYYSDPYIFALLKDSHFNVLETNKEEYAEPDGSTTIDTFISAIRE